MRKGKKVDCAKLKLARELQQLSMRLNSLQAQDM